MRISLDTHVVLWWYEKPNMIRDEVLRILKDPNNDVFVSSAVLWEIAIKSTLGKLEVPTKFYDFINQDFIELPIRWKHTDELRRLENIHQDPFDRLLIAQAKAEDLTFITKDKIILRYKFNVIKA